jgi:hypothetical protein
MRRKSFQQYVAERGLADLNLTLPAPNLEDMRIRFAQLWEAKYGKTYPPAPAGRERAMMARVRDFAVEQAATIEEVFAAYLDGPGADRWLDEQGRPAVLIGCRLTRLAFLLKAPEWGKRRAGVHRHASFAFNPTCPRFQTAIEDGLIDGERWLSDQWIGTYTSRCNESPGQFVSDEAVDVLGDDALPTRWYCTGRAMLWRIDAGREVVVNEERFCEECTR